MILTPEARNILEVAKLLGKLSDRLVFAGGAVIGFWITDPGIPSLRITDDVDTISESVSRLDYANLSQQIESLGFRHRLDENVVCRFFYEDKYILDVIPSDPSILGFGNEWLTKCVERDAWHLLQPLPDYPKIKVITPPYLLASKFQAYLDRGSGDPFRSHDLEDIFALINGRPEITTELQASETDLKEFINQTLNNLQTHRYFNEILEGHLANAQESVERAEIVIQRLKEGLK